MEEDLPVSHDHGRYSVHLGDLFLLGYCWISFWIPDGLCSAKTSKRAKGTARVIRCADRGTKIHEGLVERTCMTLWDQRFGKGPEKFFCLCLSKRCCNRIEPGKDPLHISVENGSFFVVRNRENGPRRVAADSWQAEEFIQTIWNPSVEFFDDSFCRLMEMAGTGVVPQSFPYLQNPRKACFGQSCDRWKGLQESLVVGYDRIDLSLLKHDLRDPDAVGVPVYSPREISPMFLEPLEEPVLNVAYIRIGFHHVPYQIMDSSSTGVQEG